MSLRQSHSPSQKVGPVRVSKPATSNAYHPYSPIRLKSRFFPDPSTTTLKNSAARQSEFVVQGPTIGSTNEAPITQHVDRPAMISNQPSGLKVVTRSKYWEEPLRSDVNKQKQRREYTPTHSIAEEKGKIVNSITTLHYTDEGLSFYPYFPPLIQTYHNKSEYNTAQVTHGDGTPMRDGGDSYLAIEYDRPKFASANTNSRMQSRSAKAEIQTDVAQVPSVSKERKNKRKRNSTASDGTDGVAAKEDTQSGRKATKSSNKGSEPLNHTVGIPNPRLRLVNVAVHNDRRVDMKTRLDMVKPILIQDVLKEEPWWLIIATILLNKTTGRAAIPVLYEIKKRWPTLKSLSQACVPELLTLLKPLGLGKTRTSRLIKFANVYLYDPPSQDDLRKSRVTNPKGQPRYVPTAVSHLPGAGRYALDSYRIFCAHDVGVDQWKSVMPRDKELRVYMRWRWAIEGCIWDCERGVVGVATNDYLNALCEGRLSPHCLASEFAL